MTKCSQTGQSLLEAIVAMAIFALIATAIATLSIGGLTALTQGGEHTEAFGIVQEGIEAVRSIRDNAWNELVFNQSTVDISVDKWHFTGEGTTDSVGQYTRTLSFENVCRDSSDNIATCPASYTDIQSKKVTSSVTWPIRTGITNSVQKVEYLTNWDSREWTQTDWLGGTGQTIWSDATKYSADDGNIGNTVAGQITLKSTEIPSVSNWWDSAYSFRKKITFGTSHSALSLGYTISYTMDTRIASTNVALATGNDVRVVWLPTVGSAVELDRIGDTWNAAATNIAFRLQSAVSANLNEDVDGSYYIYYANTLAGTPPMSEMNVYYFADFFNRANSSTISNGWTEWVTGGGNVAISGNTATVVGGNSAPADAGTKQSFPLGAIPGNFTLSFDWTMPSNTDNTWTHYLNIGNSATMVNTSRTTGVGPGIYNGEGSHFSPNSTENISNDLTGNMETRINGGPHSIKMIVNTTAKTFDYYRANVLRTSGNTYVSSQTTLDQIRIATDQYKKNDPAFVYDNLKITLDVADGPEAALGEEEISSIADNTAVEFNSGTYSNTQYNVSLVDLTAAGKIAGLGTYTSRISTLGGIKHWSRLLWTPTKPFYKEIPNDGGAESGYASNNWSASDNQVLYHLNEAVASTDFVDNSGNSRNATCVIATCPTAGAAGQLNGALSFDGTNDFISTSEDLNQWLGSTSSVSYWMKTTQSGNDTFWQAPGITGVESNGDGNDIFWGWLDATGKIGFQVGDGVGVKSVAAVNNNVWHNIVMTRNAASGQITLYVDGAQAAQATSDTGTKTTAFSRIGSIDDTGGTPTYFAGSIDEFAVWDNVLTSAQVTSLYQRGALRVKFQVRSCNDNACAGESFIGPDGTASTYYSELNSTSLTLPSISMTNVSDNQYFQYQMTYQTDSASLTPEVTSVSANDSAGVSMALAGNLTSSAFNLADDSPVQIIAWDETIPTCSPVCSIKLQVRTAPDSAGAPGTWTDWYGASGAGSYFTTARGNLISNDLNNNRWAQYRVELAGDGTNTPTVTEVRINYK